jgi:hypothetical protein
MAAMMTAHVAFSKVSKAFLAIMGPERQSWADLGVSQVSRGQGHRPTWAVYLRGAMNVASVLNHLDFRENRSRSENFRRVVAYGLVRFQHIEI